MFLKKFYKNLILIFFLNQILDYNLLALFWVFLLCCRFFNFMNPSSSNCSIGFHCCAVFSFMLSPPFFVYFILCNLFCQQLFIFLFRHIFYLYIFFVFVYNNFIRLIIVNRRALLGLFWLSNVRTNMLYGAFCIIMRRRKILYGVCKLYVFVYG